MNIQIRYIPHEENEWSVARAISGILHSEAFAVSEEERQTNFKVVLTENEAAGVGHNGSGTLTVPSVSLGSKFLHAVRENPIKLSGQKVRFFRSQNSPSRHLVATLDKTPFVSPDIEEKHAQTLWALDEQLRVETIQFGTYYRPDYNTPGRAFSVEWEKNYVAWLKFEYDHKLIRITVELFRNSIL
jgi:RNA-dependent RNA polymerase